MSFDDESTMVPDLFGATGSSVALLSHGLVSYRKRENGRPMFKVEQLPLWDVLKTVDDAQRAKVRKLIEDASAILDRVIETFPTYTLHNSTHAENVVKLMADLLGDRVKDLSPLEAALLMMSAFYHDIGMVFREEERNRLTEEPEWKTFLDTKPDAYLAVKKLGEVPLDIAEWYCRWRHADRVYVYLNRLPDELLKWGQTSIREELGELCRSHNLPAADLYELRKDFRGEADLRFCAVLLRLADILDFDRTRSPESVYEHLGLSQRIDPRQDASDVEWRKHLCSEGFRFPEKRPNDYQLGFVAGPDEPGVEHDVREFLTDIEGEMKQCHSVLENCSERWRALPLPVSIDRSNIHSNGYRYGEYRFTLDQEQVIDLLMGENLYEDHYVFVRELIQNALDASRYRRFIERASGNPEFEPNSIEVHQWIDQDGYQWVRFDDYGIGMDEEIVRKHLLKVGSSYYRTANFRAEILRVREKTHDNFVPISRFGIGLLSCFIASDRIEISTFRCIPGRAKPQPVRLSLNGLHGFFTLQTPPLLPSPMPAPAPEPPAYRTQPGTSIAVRLDPRKDKGTFYAKNLLQDCLAFPPVTVIFDNDPIGGDPALIDRPWFNRTSITLKPFEMDRISNVLDVDLPGIALREPLRVDIIPIDLSKHSPVPELKGQVVLAVLRPTMEWLALRKNLLKHTFIRLDFRGYNLELHIGPGVQIDQQAANIEIELPNEVLSILGLSGPEIASVSHNGVKIPTNSFTFRQVGGDHASWIQGLISLADSLRPDISVSREVLRNVPWQVHSAANLGLYRALSEIGEDLRTHRRELFASSLSRADYLLGDLLGDQFLYLDTAWPSLPILETDEGLLSVAEIQSAAKHKPIQIFRLTEKISHFDFLELCGAALVQLELDAYIDLERKGAILVSSGKPQTISESYKLFPPLTFLPFKNSSNFRSGSVINSGHPFSVWLLEKAPEIASRYPGIFAQIRSSLLDKSYGSYYQTMHLNTLIDRLRMLDPSVRAPKNLAAP